MATLTTEQALLVEARVAQDKPSKGIAYLLFFLFGPLGVQSLYLQRLSLAATECSLTIATVGCFSQGWGFSFSNGWGFLALCGAVFLGLALFYDLWTVSDCVQARAESLRRTLAGQMRAASSIRMDPVMEDVGESANGRARPRGRSAADAAPSRN